LTHSLALPCGRPPSSRDYSELDALETERTHLDLDSQRVKKELNDAIIVRDGELETTQRQIEDLYV